MAEPMKIELQGRVVDASDCYDDVLDAGVYDAVIECERRTIRLVGFSRDEARELHKETVRVTIEVIDGSEVRE